MRSRSFALPALCTLLLTSSLSPALARSRRPPTVRVLSPNGRLVAEVRTQVRAGDSLWVGRSKLWAAKGSTTRVTGKPVWSRRGDALAFVVRRPRGHDQLVVALISGDAAPATLSWPLPQSATTRRNVTWIGPSKVAVGPSVLMPQVVASWRSEVR